MDKRKKTWQANLQKAHDAIRSEKPLTKITLHVFTEQNAWLESYAQQNATTKSELIRQAIELLRQQHRIARKQDIVNDAMLEKM